MTDLDRWTRDASSWLAQAAPLYSLTAHPGLDDKGQLALGRRYLAARYDAGFGGITIAPEFGGLGLTALHKLAFDAEESRLRLPIHFFGISLGMPIPVLNRFCDDKAFVRERTIKALRGEEIWCQLFSEPAAGSDLAGLRTRAEADGNQGWRITGQKLWTSYAQYSDYGVIVARTDPGAPKHKGLTYFWIDMRAPGVTVHPVKLAGGDSHVNEVFFDSVQVEDSQRLSPVNAGFGVAMATLMIERYVAADANGYGPSLDQFISLARKVQVGGAPAIRDGRIRSAIARAYAMRSALDAISARALTMIAAGMPPGPEGSLNKLISVRSRQKLSELAMDLMGTQGLAFDPQASTKESWQMSWITAPTGRIAGGADEMLLNTIAEKILGLPQDHRPDKGVPFNQIPA